MTKIIIASKNPVKVEAVRQGFEKMFPEESFECEGVSTDSGVPDQPFGSEETLQGAVNRAEAASKEYPEADYWVGIEGGLLQSEGKMESCAWIFIKSHDMTGRARTGTFLLPEKLVSLIREGKELGTASDIVFDKVNSKQKGGSVGILTDGLIDRTRYYVEAVVLALIPFKSKDLY